MFKTRICGRCGQKSKRFSYIDSKVQPDGFTKVRWSCDLCGGIESDFE